MKRKMYLAVLAACAALTLSACGESAVKEPTKTEAEDKTTDKKDDKKEEKTEAKAGDATRLISVDNLEKYVKLGEYKGIEVEKNVMVITEDDVKAQIDEDLMNGAEETTEGARNGDIVTINYVGTKDGVAFEGGTANNYDLTLGSGGMIPGFEDGIVGMKKGETKDVNLTFPEEYFEQSLAGQEVVFKITCQNVRRKAVLTDEWAAKNTEYTDAAEYKDGVRARLEEMAAKSAQEELKSLAWSKVVEGCEVLEYPQTDLDNAAAEFKKNIQLYAQQANMDFDQFLETQGMTKEQFEDQSGQYAELKVKQLLIIQAIMDAEGISLEDEESLKVQDYLIEYSGTGDLAGLVDMYGQAGVDESIGLLRVEDFVLAHAKIRENATSGDTTGVNADGNEEEQSGTPDENDVIDEELEAELGAEDDETVEIGEE